MQLSKQLADRAVICMHTPLRRTRRRAFSQPSSFFKETRQASSQFPVGSLAQPQHGQQAPQQSVSQPLPPLPHQNTAEDWRGRTQLLVGDEALQRLAEARVLVVGLGGVGSYAAEFLARAGVGSMVIVDNDHVDLSNINRQLPALHSTVGLSKAELMAQRLRDINPSLLLEVKEMFVTPETVTRLLVEGALGHASEMDGSSNSSSSSSSSSSRSSGDSAQPEGLIRAPFDWVLDAIDSLTPKQLLLAAAHAVGVKTIASMGAGGRRDPSRVRVGPISATVNDRFAANMRKSLRRFGVDLDEMMCVWSDEPLERRSLALTAEKNPFKRYASCRGVAFLEGFVQKVTAQPWRHKHFQQRKWSFYGTISFLPAQFGLTAAAYVVNNLIDSQPSSNGTCNKVGSTSSSPCYSGSKDGAATGTPYGMSSGQKGKDGLPPSKWKSLQLRQILEQYSQQQQQQQQQQHACQMNGKQGPHGSQFKEQQQQQQQQQQQLERHLHPKSQAVVDRSGSLEDAAPDAAPDGSLPAANMATPDNTVPPSHQTPSSSHRAAVVSGLGFEGEGI